MKHAQLIEQFKEDLSQLSCEVETSVAMGHFDLNKICEDVFCGLFKELYGFTNLRNLNTEEKQNFPGIDLADDTARIAIQVTSEKTIDKIKDSLTKVVDHRLYEHYDRVIFYVLTRKQGSYSTTSIDAICDDKLYFDPTTDVLDFRNLATKAASATPKALKQASEILGSYLRGVDVGLADRDFDPPEEPAENLAANLLELYLPSTLFIAELSPDVFGKRKPRNQRKAVGEFVRTQERSVPSDYEVHSGKLITFHDLTESDNPFAFVIDVGTAEPLKPSEFYEIDEDHERVFKSLLRFGLQQKLYHHRVLWKHLEGLFIFLPARDNDNIRTISWVGQKRATRTVFERRFKKDDNDKILSVRHFAFSVSFFLIAGEWYISISPDWFFSFGDGYRQSAYGDKLISGLKRMEKNRSVFDQFRFLCAWLKELDDEDLFSEEAITTPQITFGPVLDFGGARPLDEELWEPLVVVGETDSEQGRLRIE